MQTNAPWSWDQLIAQENAMNRHWAIVHWFIQWGNEGAPFSYSLPLLNATRAHGSLPMITWMPWVGPPATSNPYPLKDIAAGKFDPYLDTWAAGARAYGHPLLLRFAPEMNGDWLPWGAGVHGNTPADYVAAYRHVHDRLAVARNIQWVWSPDGDPGGAWTPLGSFYPGDAYADWLAVDVYNVGTTQPGGTWRLLSSLMTLPYARLTALNANKPMMLAEWASVEQGGDKGSWMQDAARVIPQKYPRIRAVVWFSEANTQWALNSSAGAIAGARQGFGASPYCLTLPY